jgi:hypothetical protein
MQMADLVEDKENRFPNGFVFNYEDFRPDVKTRETFIKSLNRMIENPTGASKTN